MIAVMDSRLHLIIYNGMSLDELGANQFLLIDVKKEDRKPAAEEPVKFPTLTFL